MMRSPVLIYKITKDPDLFCKHVSLMICNMISSPLIVHKTARISCGVFIFQLTDSSQSPAITELPVFVTQFSPPFFCSPLFSQYRSVDASLWCCCLDAVIIVCLQRDAPCLCPGWHRRIQTENAAAHLHSFIHFAPLSPSGQGNDKLKIFIWQKHWLTVFF